MTDARGTHDDRTQTPHVPLAFRMRLGDNELDVAGVGDEDVWFVVDLVHLWLMAVREDGPGVTAAVDALTKKLSASSTRLAAAVKKAGVAAHSQE